MSFIFRCPWCDQKIECAENDDGQYACCPCCDKTILVKKNPSADDLTKNQDSMTITCDSKKKLGDLIVSEVFVCHGIFHAISAFCAVISLLIAWERNSTTGVWCSGAWLIAAISLAVFSFGIAEFFGFIDRISRESKRTADALNVIRRILEEKK